MKNQQQNEKPRIRHVPETIDMRVNCSKYSYSILPALGDVLEK